MISHVMAANLVVFSSSLVCGWLITQVVRKKALERGVLAHPTDDRWHKKSTALCGGIATAVTLVINWLAAFFLSKLFTEQSFHSFISVMLPLIVGSGILFVMGLWDDITGVRPGVKLACQIVASLVVISMGHLLQLSGYNSVNICLTMIWVVLVTNSFNLIDNMDGLSSGIGCIVALFIAVLLYPNLSFVGMLAIVLAGACAGFLIHNYPPATIFMGDCGSQVLGFCCSFLVILYTEHGAAKVSHGVIVSLLLLAVPLFDTVFVSFTRIREGRSVFEGGCDHISHKLVSLGLSEKQTVHCLWAVSVLTGLLACFVGYSN